MTKGWHRRIVRSIILNIFNKKLRQNLREKAKGNCRLTNRNKVVTNLLHGAPQEVEGRVVGLKELVT